MVIQFVSRGDMENRIGKNLIESKQSIDLYIANTWVDMLNAVYQFYRLILASD